MALVKSGNIGGSSQGGVNYELHASQTGGSGNSRTVQITLKLKLAGNPSYPSWFGYPAQWKGIVNGTYSGWSGVKGNESWNTNDGWRSYSWTHTTDVGTTSSKAITVGFQLDSYNGSDLWDSTQTGSFTVGQTNTPPYFTSGEQWLQLRDGSSTGTVLTGTIPENVSTLYANWGYASDNEGGTLTYILQEQVNGGGWATIDTGTDRAHTWNIGAGNEGQSRQLWVTAKDSSNAQASSGVYSAIITKNVFTGDSLASSSSINFNSSNINFTYSGAKNTNGNTSFSRVLSCDGITVYNSSLGASPATITIYKSGTVPTGCYIKFDDIKNKFKNNSYQGTLNFTLRTTNAYGTAKTSSKSIAVDLRTNPNAATGQVISTSTSESTIYKKIASSNNHYFIPNGSGHARVKWNAGSGKLGEAITYELYVAYGSGSWQKLADLSSGTLYYNHVIPTQSTSQQVKYKIRTKTSYGYHSDADTPAQTLHYYNAPSISTGTITRGGTTADVKVTIKTNSSIPSISTTGSWQRFAKGTTTPVQQSGNLSAAQTEQNIALTGLTDAGQYDLKVTYNDNTGFGGSNKTHTIAIGANSPIFFVNKYGAGINGVKAEANAALNIKGDLKINNIVMKYQVLGANVNLNDLKTPGEYNQDANANTSTALNYPEALAGHLTVTNGAGVQQRYHIYNTSRVYTRAQYSTGGWTAWAKEYNTLNKPTAADTGALASSGNVTLNTNANSASAGLNIHGTNTQGELWAGTGGFVLQSKGNASLHLGANNTTDLVLQTDKILLGKNLDVGSKQLLNVAKLNGYSFGTAQSGMFKNTIPVVKSDGVMEIGQYIDFHTSDTDYSMRFTCENGTSTSLQCSGNANVLFFRRHDGTRYGYIGNGTDTNDDFYLYSDINYLRLGATGHWIFETGHFAPYEDDSWYLGAGWDGMWHRWKTVYSTNGSISGSDASLKEDIVRLDGTPVVYDETKDKLIEQENVKVSNSGRATQGDYYNFFKDRFKPTYYKYKNDNDKELKEDTELSKQQRDEHCKQIGFIAQDYVNDIVAKEFIVETGKELMYDNMCYVNSGFIALQETIKELEKVKQENKQLKEDLALIKEHLGIA